MFTVYEIFVNIQSKKFGISKAANDIAGVPIGGSKTLSVSLARKLRSHIPS